MQDKRNRKESDEWLSMRGTVANNHGEKGMIVVTSRKRSTSHLYVSANTADVWLWKFWAIGDSACGFETFVTWSVTIDTFCELTTTKKDNKISWGEF
jgi:hypothetical protein